MRIRWLEKFENVSDFSNLIISQFLFGLNGFKKSFDIKKSGEPLF